MGTGPPPKRFDPKSEKQKFEITCIKVRSYLELQRDRRQNQANGKEKTLIQMFNNPTRSKQDEVQKASSIITDLNFVKASNIVIRFCDILKENSLRVVEAKGSPSKVENLMPYIESICWAAKPLNLSCISEFQAQMVYFFGQDLNESVQKTTKVDPDLKDCFKELLPTPLQINDYMVAFSERIGIPLGSINACGHEFAPRGGFGGPGVGHGGQGGGGGQYLPPQNQDFGPPAYSYGPPVQFISHPNPQQQSFPPNPAFGGQNPSFGAYQQPPPPSFQGPPQGYMFPPPSNQFGGGFQQPPPHDYQQSGGFGQPPPQETVGGGTTQGYPEFGGVNLPKNNAALGGGAGPQNTQGFSNDKLPNLDDFEERMKKLRENL